MRRIDSVPIQYSYLTLSSEERAVGFFICRYFLFCTATAYSPGARSSAKTAYTGLDGPRKGTGREGAAPDEISIPSHAI